MPKLPMTAPSRRCCAVLLMASLAGCSIPSPPRQLVEERLLRPELDPALLELVAGLDGDALAGLALAKPRGTGAQTLDRHHHAAGEQQAGEQGKRQAAEQQAE